MRLLLSKVAFVSLVVSLAGCAGTNFVRVSDDALVLGETTQEQITARLGKPYQEGVVTKNSRKVKTASYAYASAGGEAAVEGVTPARGQGFYFLEGTLVGYEYTSSWKEDCTDFDSAKLEQIKKGVSTLNDVEALLGKPGGKYIYPLTRNTDEVAVNYFYSQAKGFDLYQKKLLVTLNKDGVVTDFEYAESGEN